MWVRRSFTQAYLSPEGPPRLQSEKEVVALTGQSEEEVVALPAAFTWHSSGSQIKWLLILPRTLAEWTVPVSYLIVWAN